MNRVDAVKESMGFGVISSCGTCEYCQVDDYYSEMPTVHTCTFAGQITFTVEEYDSCREWSDGDE